MKKKKVDVYINGKLTDTLYLNHNISYLEKKKIKKHFQKKYKLTWYYKFLDKIREIFEFDLEP